MNAHEWLSLALTASIMLTVMGFGLTTTLADATYLFRQPSLLLRAVVAMSVIMPVIVATLTHVFAFRFEVAVALVALAVSPVPPIIQKKQLTAGGRIEYVVGLMFAMSVLAIVLVPLSLWILDRIFDRHGVVTLAGIAKIMATTVLIPLLVGLAIRHVWPKAERASGPVLVIAAVLLGITVLILLYGLWPMVLGFIGNGMVFAMIVIALIGLAVGHVLGGPIAGDRTALAISTSSRHPAVALAVASSGPLVEARPELAIILTYLVVATIVGIPYQKWRARSVAAHKSA